MLQEKFEYSNSWNSPRLTLKQSVGKAVGVLSLAHGLDLETFHEEKSLFRSVGGFKVIGDFPEVRQFGESLEQTYAKYLTNSQTDWDYYQSFFESMQ